MIFNVAFGSDIKPVELKLIGVVMLDFKFEVESIEYLIQNLPDYKIQQLPDPYKIVIKFKKK